MTARTSSDGTTGGTIRIVDTGGVREQTSEHLDGTITIDLAEEEAPTIAAALESGERPEVVLEEPPTGSPGSGFGSLLPQPGPELGGLGRVLGVLPAATLLLGGLAAALLGPSVWSVGASPLGEIAVRLGHVWAFGISLAGTLWLWNDARSTVEGNDARSNDARTRPDAGSRWPSSPVHYVAGGAAGFALLGVAFYLAVGVPVGQVAVAAAGLLVAGVPMSSAVAGPVYLYARHRAPDRR